MNAENDIALTIEALGARGDGLATFEDERVIVPYAAPGDRVTVRLSRDGEERLVGRIRAIEAPGPVRVTSPCPHFGPRTEAGCGGCALQHIEAETYRAWKLEQLHAVLERNDIPGDTIGPLAISPAGSRRRADFTGSRRKEGLLLGYNARGSNRVIDLAACTVLRPSLVALLAPLRALLGPLTKTGDALEVRLAATDSGVDVLLVAAFELGAGARQRIAAFAEQTGVARVSRRHPRHPGVETVIEPRPVRVMLGGAAIPLPPGAFLQATAEGEAALTATVTAALVGGKRIRRVADLYAGIGTFAVPLARAGLAVHAVDSGKAEMAALAEGARAAMLPAVSTETRDLERRPFDTSTLNDFDAVVFDPPRAGAAAQAALIAQSRVPHVVAVSCNPASFARDARTLLDGGYRLERIEPVDQFLWSTHLELAAVFRR